MLNKMWLFATLLISASFTSNYSFNNLSPKITVIGMALNDKYGAIVETENGDYILDGVDKWEEEYYGKRVSVTGRFKVVENRRNKGDNTGPQVQRREGKCFILRKPSWKLLE